MTEAPKPPPLPPRRLPPPRPGSLAHAPTVGVSGASGVREAANGTSDVPKVLDAETPTPAAAKVDAYVGKTIDGRYVVERVLGEGGMGVVYAARHRVIDKKFAIKVLRGEMASDREANERFLQEARAASAIGNPHIVDISDFGQLPDGSTYFVMEFLAGKSLSALLGEATGPMPVPRLCHIAKQIAQGLAAAHAANIIHRDLKPDNVMLVKHGAEKDFVKILDFGIAKVGSGTKKMTRAGSVFGTPHYMSPEQAAGTTVDHRTDVYALGVMLYEMASGKVPFDADNFMGILTQHMYKAPVPIRALVPEVDVPPGLDAIVLKCLTKKPEGRYASMDQLARDLEKLEQGLMPDAVQEMMARSGAFSVPSDYFRSSKMPVPVPAEPVVPVKRWPLYAVMGAVGTIVGVVGVIIVAKSLSGTAHALPSAPPGERTSTSLAPPATATATATAGAAATPPAPAPAREVLVSVVPSDAALSRDGRDLGGAPIALHLADGEVATLVITRKGYKTKTVTVDGNSPKQMVTLDPAWSSPGKAAKGPASSPKNGGLDDVGDPFAKH
ncbi:MAG TPA: serine/threonine-protein kinase [Polyangiaceae bacterium]|nr:serine/threonine-protein kinase [Polyangiaceae bacterium]